MEEVLLIFVGSGANSAVRSNLQIGENIVQVRLALQGYVVN